jgi:hypothetical protein
MNGKKAKLLRRLAGVDNTVATYKPMEKTFRKKKTHNGGTDVNGNPTFIHYETVTLCLTNGCRKLYKRIKTGYKRYAQ